MSGKILKGTRAIVVNCMGLAFLSQMLPVCVTCVESKGQVYLLVIGACVFVLMSHFGFVDCASFFFGRGGGVGVGVVHT